MALYWPSMAATLFVPTADRPAGRKLQEDSEELFRFDLRPIRARLVSNNHNEADELEVTFVYDECGIDPRFLRSATIYFYLADAYAYGGFTPGFDNLRFVGIARDVTRSFTGRGRFLRMLFHDYTCLFLENKPLCPSGVPLFTDTLTTAWQRICDNTGYLDMDTRTIQSSVSDLRDQLEFHGDIDPNVTLGKAVPDRIARLGKLQLESGPSDSWAVWQAAVMSLGLVSFVRGDRCIVTTATDFYTSDDPPVFLYGKNILEVEESRKLGNVSAKNVALRSYDPSTGRTLEALYPDPSLALRPKKLGARVPKKPPKTVRSQDYECFDLPFAVADQERLEQVAQLVWEERTRQELSGRLTTVEMAVPTANGSQNAFDLLSLGAGDQVQVEIEREALDAVQAYTTVPERAAQLILRGYTADTANFIAENLADLEKLPAQFLIKTIETEIDASGDDGGSSFQIAIEYVNRIDITANAAFPIGAGTATNQAKGTRIPPMSGQKPKRRGPPPKP